MTEPIHEPAPEAFGDIVPGEPPVPITVWHVPAARAGETVSIMLAERLVRNFTHSRRLVIDLTSGEQLFRAIRSTRRRYARYPTGAASADTDRATLIVAGWPCPNWSGIDADARTLLQACADRLMVGGCLAVVLAAGDLTINQQLVAAARATGLTYLQHIVAAHDLTQPRGSLADGHHLNVHSDVLVFSRPQPDAWETVSG